MQQCPYPRNWFLFWKLGLRNSDLCLICVCLSKQFPVYSIFVYCILLLYKCILYTFVYCIMYIVYITFVNCIHLKHYPASHYHHVSVSLKLQKKCACDLVDFLEHIRTGPPNEPSLQGQLSHCGRLRWCWWRRVRKWDPSAFVTMAFDINRSLVVSQLLYQEWREMTSARKKKEVLTIKLWHGWTLEIAC